MNRHFVRSIILQTLFECDFSDSKCDLRKTLEYTISNFNDVKKVSEEILVEMEETMKAILEKQSILDELIEKAAPEWPIDKIAGVDRNILRLGLYELLFADHDKVPEKVAINEAVELAKEFGSEKSSKFINGVIGAVYREIGEPGKDYKQSKKSHNNKIEKPKTTEIPVEEKAGAVIYSVNDGSVQICFVHDIFGHWTIVKGNNEKGKIEEAIVNIVKTKTNLDIEVEGRLGENEYTTHHPEKGSIRRHVTYFLVRANYAEPKLQANSTGLDDVKWFELDDVSDLSLYDDVSGIIAKGIEQITIKK